jgi:hypothetical protein
MPKSRVRRPKNGGKKPVRRSPLPPRLSDLMMRDAKRIVDSQDLLAVEAWASDFLGQAWYLAPLGERDAERTFCLEVCGRACTTPSPHGLAAVASLARVAPASAAQLLAETVEILAETQPLPSWHTATVPEGKDWTPVTAWRAVNVWDSERVLLIDYDGPHPHTLMAQIERPGGLWVGVLSVLEPGAADRWDELRADQEVPMPLIEQPVADVLAEVADAMRMTDITVPRNDGDDFVSNRALAWSRCRDHLSQKWTEPDWTEPERLPESEIRRLVDGFTAASGRDDETMRSLAEMFLDYGEGYIHSGPLAWSPDQVMLFLTDWLPRKGILDAAQRVALPDALRLWLTFALTERGTDHRWITPVTDAVGLHLDAFRAAFDDKSAWGPGKQVTAAISDLDLEIDFSDRQSVQEAVSALNAHRLAEGLARE